jgi:hypothetical protein
MGRPVEDSRTLTSLTLGLTGLAFVVEVLGFEGASWRSLTRPFLSLVLGAVLLAGFLVTIYTPFLRGFFAFEPVKPTDWIIILTAVAGALIGQYVLSRYWQQILDFITGARPDGQVNRGRSL